MTTWTFGAEGSGLWFTVSLSASGEATVEMLEGSMDLNALWFSDGDGTKDGDTTLAKQQTSLNMNGSGSLDAEGNTIVWDEVNVLSISGLGKEGASKTTFLTTGETQTFQLDASTLAYLAGCEDLTDLTLGIRATSVNGGDSVKLNATGVSDGDSQAPIFDSNGNYVFEYDENQLIGAVVGIVGGASDAGGGVTQYRFAAPPSGAGLSVQASNSVSQASNSVSSDGYFEIDNSGNIILTELGWAATVNDYDDQNQTFDYYIEAGDAAGNWSLPQKITLSLKDIGQGSGSTFYLSLDRTGVWFDANEDGKRDGGESSATLVASGDLWRVKDVDMEADNVTIRVVDFRVATPLDLKGFGSGDKLIMDYETNKNDWYNLPLDSTQWWSLNSRPTKLTANFNRKSNFVSSYTVGKSASIRLQTYARFFPKLQNGYTFSNILDFSHAVGGVVSGSMVSGYLHRYFQARPYTKFTDFRYASVTQLFPFNNPNYTSQAGKIQSISTYDNTLVAKGLGTGYSVEVIKPDLAGFPLIYG